MRKQSRLAVAVLSVLVLVVMVASCTDSTPAPTLAPSPIKPAPSPTKPAPSPVKPTPPPVQYTPPTIEYTPPTVQYTPTKITGLLTKEELDMLQSYVLTEEELDRLGSYVLTEEELDMLRSQFPTEEEVVKLRSELRPRVELEQILDNLPSHEELEQVLAQLPSEADIKDSLRQLSADNTEERLRLWRTWTDTLEARTRQIEREAAELELRLVNVPTPAQLNKTDAQLEEISIYLRPVLQSDLAQWEVQFAELLESLVDLQYELLDSQVPLPTFTALRAIEKIAINKADWKQVIKRWLYNIKWPEFPDVQLPAPFPYFP